MTRWQVRIPERKTGAGGSRRLLQVNWLIVMFGISIALPVIAFSIQKGSAFRTPLSSSASGLSLLLRQVLSTGQNDRWIVYLGNARCGNCVVAAQRIADISDGLLQCSGIRTLIIFSGSRRHVGDIDRDLERIRQFPVELRIRQTATTAPPRILYVTGKGLSVYEFHSSVSIDAIRSAWASCGDEKT